jgi:hypothetical protein
MCARKLSNIYPVYSNHFYKLYDITKKEILEAYQLLWSIYESRTKNRPKNELRSASPKGELTSRERGDFYNDEKVQEKNMNKKKTKLRPKIGKKKVKASPWANIVVEVTLKSKKNEKETKTSDDTHLSALSSKKDEEVPSKKSGKQKRARYFKASSHQSNELMFDKATEEMINLKSTRFMSKIKNQKAQLERRPKPNPMPHSIHKEYYTKPSPKPTPRLPLKLTTHKIKTKSRITKIHKSLQRQITQEKSYFNLKSSEVTMYNTNLYEGLSGERIQYNSLKKLNFFQRVVYWICPLGPMYALVLNTVPKIIQPKNISHKQHSKHLQIQPKTHSIPLPNLFKSAPK